MKYLLIERRNEVRNNEKLFVIGCVELRKTSNAIQS